jgi:hypothetical protein
MDFNATIDLIIKDLEEAGIIIEDLKKYPGVPAIQVELAKSKCRSAGELMALLKNTNTADIQSIENPIIASKPKEIIEKKSSVNKLTVKEAIPATEQLVSESANKTQLVPENDISLKNPVKTEEARNPEPVEELRKKGDSAILADKFSHLAGSFNEQLGVGKTRDNFNEPGPVKPIGKLSEAIGINDKFLFTREIFRNSTDSYSQAITRLDNVTSLDDAKAVIMSYTENSNENEAVKQLLDLVKRKLPSNE